MCVSRSLAVGVVALPSCVSSGCEAVTLTLTLQPLATNHAGTRTNQAKRAKLFG